MHCSTPGLPVHHQLLEFTQTHVHWVSDAIQPSHHLSSPSPPALNLSQHQGLLKWVGSSHEVAKVLEWGALPSLSHIHTHKSKWPISNWKKFNLSRHQFNLSSVAQLCPPLCNPMNRSTPGLPVYHQLPEFTQTQVHRVRDAIRPSHPLSSPSPPALYLSQHQSLFKWVSSSHQVAKVLEFQLQHQSFQWTSRTDLL